MFEKAAAIGAVVALGLIAVPLYGDDQNYKIQIDRPVKVGDHRRFERTTVEDVHYIQREGERTVTDSDRLMGAKIIADEKVMAVDQGTPTTVEYTIVALFSYDGKTDTELLQAGSTLTTVVGEPTEKFTVNGKPVSIELQRALAFLIHLRKHGDVLQFDKLFNTTIPRQMGESWNLDGESIARIVGRSVPIAEAPVDKMNGRATVLKLDSVDKVPCVTIEVELSANDLNLKPPTSQPSSSGFNRGDVSMHYVENVPVDPTSLAESGSFMMVRHYSGQFHNGSRLDSFEETVRSAGETKSTP